MGPEFFPLDRETLFCLFRGGKFFLATVNIGILMHISHNTVKTGFDGPTLNSILDYRTIQNQLQELFTIFPFCMLEMKSTLIPFKRSHIRGYSVACLQKCAVKIRLLNQLRLAKTGLKIFDAVREVRAQ